MDAQTYKYFFNLIKSEVIKNDPIGLIDGGAPEDEYDAEIGELVVRLPNTKKDKREYYKTISDVFGGLGKVRNTSCTSLAGALLEKLSGKSIAKTKS